MYLHEDRETFRDLLEQVADRQAGTENFRSLYQCRKYER